MRKASRWQEPLAASRACVLYASIRTQRADETSNEPTPEIARCPVQLEDAILVVLVIPPSGTSCQCLSKRWEQSRITRTTIFLTDLLFNIECIAPSQAMALRGKSASLQMKV